MKNSKIIFLVLLSSLLDIACNHSADKELVEQSYKEMCDELYKKHDLGKYGVTIDANFKIDPKDMLSKEEMERSILEMKKSASNNDAYLAENEKFMALMKTQKPKSAYELFTAMEKFPLVKAQTMQGMGGQAKWNENLAKMKKEGSKFTKSPF